MLSRLFDAVDRLLNIGLAGALILAAILTIALLSYTAFAVTLWAIPALFALLGVWFLIWRSAS